MSDTYTKESRTMASTTASSSSTAKRASSMETVTIVLEFAVEREELAHTGSCKLMGVQDNPWVAVCR